MLSDAQKKEIAHAAEVLRASANVMADSYDAATSPDLASVIVDARDTADKLDAMATQARAVRYIDETEMA